MFEADFVRVDVSPSPAGSQVQCLPLESGASSTVAALPGLPVPQFTRFSCRSRRREEELPDAAFPGWVCS